MDWLAWVLLGIPALGVFIAVLSAVMLSSAISRREERWRGGNDGAD